MQETTRLDCLFCRRLNQAGSLVIYLTRTNKTITTDKLLLMCVCVLTAISENVFIYVYKCVNVSSRF